MIPPNILPGGAEITIDRHDAGFEKTCHICRSVITRHEPGPEGGKRTISRPFATMQLDTHVVIPGLTAYRLNLPVDVCGTCLPFIVAPFFPAFAEGFNGLTDIPTEICHALGFAIVNPADADRIAAAADGMTGAVRQMLGADVDEHQGDDATGAAYARQAEEAFTALAEDGQRRYDERQGAELADEAAPSSSTSTTAAPSSDERLAAAARELADHRGGDVDEAAPSSPAAPSSSTSATAPAADVDDDRDELAAV